MTELVNLSTVEPDPEPFDANALVDAAIARHDGDGLLDPSIVEPLSIICRGLEATANLTAVGRWATQRYIRRLLDGHLEIDAYRRADPGVDQEAIEAPIFVVGAPRTGTTAMHRLLVTNPALRAPEAWEFLAPVPPPEAESFATDPRIEVAAEELTFPQRVSTGLRKIHIYSARMPKECLSAMSFTFRSEEFISRYDLPEYVEWLSSADLGPAYEMHRSVVRILQRRMPSRRWIFKSPAHLQGIRELVATYPDAAFVVTHRDPAGVLASVSSLIATMRGAFSDDVDQSGIGRYHTALYAGSLDALVDHVDDGLLAPERTAHVAHADIVADGMSVLEQVHQALAVPFTDATRSAAAIEIAGDREDGAGAHRYELADYGLTPDDAGPAFERYRARFLSGPTASQ